MDYLVQSTGAIWWNEAEWLWERRGASRDYRLFRREIYLIGALIYTILFSLLLTCFIAEVTTHLIILPKKIDDLI